MGPIGAIVTGVLGLKLQDVASFDYARLPLPVASNLAVQFVKRAE